MDRIAGIIRDEKETLKDLRVHHIFHSLPLPTARHCNTRKKVKNVYRRN